MIDLNDVLVLVGLALVLAGAWLVSPPFAIVAFGAVLAICGVHGARKG